MKNKISIVALSLLVLATRCADNTPETPVDKADSSLSRIEPDTVATIIKALPDTIFAQNKDTTAVLANGEAFIKGHIRANKGQPVYTVNGLKGQSFTATIKPVEKGGNVRINQIQLPDDSFDGPFGDSLRYTLKRSGKLRFIIGQNMMAGDPWTGDFIFHLKAE